ncbi:PfkB family carbohydrate kinase [Miltoncostaea marina]|uniref:PfkB family carbohydrate kinase n=1 Tax=Miltoncostaea marina TaxID=2843215 RepID=UPI001C3C8A9F|nr:PfkB family carbohydrate kinase [Miltoncostaea marina]
MSPVTRPRVAVVGHVEWVTHARGVMPLPGEITYVSEPFDEPAGGGGVSAAQVARLGAECLFFTALGDDGSGAQATARLEAEGVTVLAARRAGPQTRAVSATGPTGDRAILVIGAATSARIEDALPWDELAGCDAAYFTGHDSATVAAARRARVLVATSRRLRQLVESGVRADVVVASASDPAEAVDPDALPVAPGAIVWTEGARGGRYETAGGASGRWEAAPPPGPPIDSYGCGDSFAGGLTVGLGRGLELDAALALGARCGAACLTGRGALAAQLVEA